MAKIAIVVGNPRATAIARRSGEAYQRGAESGGHQASCSCSASMNFDAVLREGYRREQALEPDLVAARSVIDASDHLVFVFPLWCGDMPAIIKGFFERLLQPDLLAIQAAGGKGDWKVFKGKSARVIMTMGMPGWFYRWYFGAHAFKLLKRNILQFVGIRRCMRPLWHGRGGRRRQARAMAARGRGARPRRRVSWSFLSDLFAFGGRNRREPGALALERGLKWRGGVDQRRYQFALHRMRIGRTGKPKVSFSRSLPGI